MLEPGAWNDPRRPRRSWPPEVYPTVPPGRPLVRTLRFSAGVLGWPLILAFSLSLSPELFEVRALSVAFAVALLVGERWRDAERRRQEAELEQFLRALEGPSPLVPLPLTPAAVGRPRGRSDASGATVDACLEGHRLGGRSRRRVSVEPDAAPISVERPVRPVDFPTRVERSSERERPTIPDSVRTIHVGLVRDD